MAAVQYGPTAKTSDGLGFIEPADGGLFRTTGQGNELAKGLDESLGGQHAPTLLKRLTADTASEQDARGLFPHWSVLSPSKRERHAFRAAFFDKPAIDSITALGRRSSTISLALLVLKAATGGLEVAEIRRRMFYGLIGRKNANVLENGLRLAWHRWIVLQVRQAQRLAMEAILSWIERQLIFRDDRDTGSMVARAVSLCHDNFRVVPQGKNVNQVKAALFKARPDAAEFLESSKKNVDFDLFVMMDRVKGAVEEADDLALVHALRLLFVCDHFAEVFDKLGTVSDLLANGAGERISLLHWRDFVQRSAQLPMKDFILLVLEQYVISQHLAVAARRFDGGTQRLRITIDEQGLMPLVDRPLGMRVTPDRLPTALSLLSQCDLVHRDPITGLYSAKT
jgi:hypothetical protein